MQNKNAAFLNFLVILSLLLPAGLPSKTVKGNAEPTLTPSTSGSNIIAAPAALDIPHDPPVPGDLNPEAEQARAQQAMEDVLAKYLAYWGPRYEASVSTISIDSGWALATADWKSSAKLLPDSIQVLAHMRQDGTWKAAMPGSDNEYLQWVDLLPIKLASINEKFLMRIQAVKADSLKPPQAKPAVPSYVGIQSSKTIISLQVTPTPTPAPPFIDQQAIKKDAYPTDLMPTPPLSNYFYDSQYHYQFIYPSGWEVRYSNYTGYLETVSFSNQGQEKLVVYVLEDDSQHNEGEFGNKITAYRYSLPGGQNPPQEILQFNNGTYAFQIQFFPGEADSDILDNVLSTFRFTDNLSELNVISASEVLSSIEPLSVFPQCPGVTKSGWPAYGSVIVPSGNWNGVDVFSNGGDVNNACSATYGYQYQCVELAQRFFAQKWGYPSHWGVSYAYQMYSVHPSGTTAYSNGSSTPPKWGDALVFGGGTGGYGHVAVVTGVSNGRVNFVEENWTSSGQASLAIDSNNNVEARSGYTVLGWVHASQNQSLDGDFNSPSENQTISSSMVHISGWANNFQRAHFTATWNGSSWHQIGPDFTSSPFGFDFDLCSAGVPDGQITLGLDIWDSSGNSINSPHGNRHFNKSFNCTPRPSANFDALPTSGPAPLIVAMHIVNTSNITSCSWEYGDGQTSTSCVSSHNHTYNNPGTYTVKLTVNGPGGSDSMIREGYIHVDGPAITTPSNPSPGDGTILERNNDTNLSWSTNGVNCSVHVWGGSIDINPSGSCSNLALHAQRGGDYHWQVTASNSSGSATSPTWGFKIKPYEPTNLTATAISPTQIILDWTLSSDEPSDIDGYDIYYSNGTLINSVSKGISSYTVNSLSCTNSYSFYVRSIRQGVSSNPSNTISGQPQACDSEKPVITWLAPTSDYQTYHVSNQTVQLIVDASDNVSVNHVHFWRWDAVNLVDVEIGNVYSPPYQINLDSNVLNYDWNEIIVEAHDNAGNVSDWKYIWLYRDQPMPDLMPYAPTGYSNPVIPSSIQNNHTLDTLHAGQSTYFDWHFTNSGTATASGPFYVELWVDDTRLIRYPYSDYYPGWGGGFDDWSETITTPGWHTLKLITDPDNTIVESDETNNQWEQQFYWTPTAPFTDTFEGGIGDWTASGLWHQVASSSPYSQYHSSSHSWWYGQENTGNYDTGATNSGDLTSPSTFIPNSGLYLRFWYQYQTETQSTNWDQRWIQISVDGGSFANILQLSDDLQSTWLQNPAIDLSGYAGHTIQVRFHFDTLDAYNNGYRGWFVDDFDISTTPPPTCADSHEPNNVNSQATGIGYDQAVTSDICPSGDMDFYSFTGAAGDKVVADIDAAVSGSLLDSQIFLLDQDGNTVLQSNNNDAMSVDSKLGYTLPATGTYFIKVLAWNHPSVGGAGYYYTLHLYTDATNPISVQITSPIDGSWINPTSVTINTTASDTVSGITRVEFLWHSADWSNPDWVWLGTDNNGVDGWSYNFNTSSLAEQQGGALYIWAFDYVGNWVGAGSWNLGIDRTPPTTGMGVYSSPYAHFTIYWNGSDNLSGISSYDVQYKDGSSGEWLDLTINTTDTYYQYPGANGHTYYFRARARDFAGNQSEFSGGDGDTQFAVQVCTVSPDTYESDDTYNTAKPISTDGINQTHTFHVEGDQDWARFIAYQGVSYTISTENSGGNADTLLSLYGTDGTTLISFNDDYPDLNLASRIIWMPTVSGDYYVKVDHHNPWAFGCTTQYYLSITHESDVIFADGFESGNLSAWSTNRTDGGDLSVTSGAALIGSQGLQAVINDNNPLYVVDDSPVTEARYRARFYFDPNSIPMAHGDSHAIFYGYNSVSVGLFQVYLYYNNGYQLRLGTIEDGTTWRYTPYIKISDARQFIEIDWQAATADGANNGAFTLWVDGVQKTSLSALDNDTRRVGKVLLGAINSIDAGTRGTYFFDAFESHRQSYIGMAGVQADFSATPTSGSAPLAVSFTSLSFPVEKIGSYLWDFGDGNTSPEANPSHTYTTSGDFTVSLTITGDGDSDTVTRTGFIHLSDVIFADGFESSDLSAWSSNRSDGGDLSVTSSAALIGSQGLQAVINDNNPLYVVDDSPVSEARYRARFYFDPNSIPMAHGDSHAIFYGYNSVSVGLFQVYLYYNNGYQLRLGTVEDGTTWRYTPYIKISDARQFIEIDWQAATADGANNGAFTLWVDGVQKTSLSALDNDTRRVGKVLLGAINSIDAGTRGTYFFDAFESHRQSYIGMAGVQADFSAAPTSGSAPLAVSFTSLSYPVEKIGSYLWDFGDGSTSPEANPSHTYTASGDFTVSLTVTGDGDSDTVTRTGFIHLSDVIFADGFESGNLSAWSSNRTDGGDLSVTSGAALIGSLGLQGVIDDNNPIYLVDDSPTSEPRYRARFYFDPNSIPMAHGDSHAIFYGYNSVSVGLFQVYLYYNNGYQLRLGAVEDGTSWKYSSIVSISDAPQTIEIDWQAATADGANNGTFTLWVDGVQKTSLSALDNDTRRVGKVLLGSISSIDAGTRGTYFFDAFDSRRQTQVGP